MSTSSTTCFIQIGVPEHDGAIIHPKFGITTIGKISNADGSSRTFLVGEMDYGLLDYYWETCHGTATVRGGATRWAVGYAGVTWGSTAGAINSEYEGPKLYTFYPAGFEAFRSDHSGGVNFAFVDGSVRFVSDEIDGTIYKALATRNGGETIDVIQ